MMPIRVPSGWRRTKVGLISKIKYGLGVPPKSLEKGTPMLRATNVKRGRIAAEGLMRVDASLIPSAKDAVLREGDIIVVRSGAYTGDSALVTGEWAGSVAGYDLIVSPDRYVVPAFLAFWMLSQRAHSHFQGHRGRSAQPHLNRQQVGEAVIELPPLAEQLQIVRVLSAVQRAIERQERLIALTAELKKALAHKLFTEGTRSEQLKPTEIGPVPENWSVVEIGTLGKCVTGTTPSTKVGDYYTPEEYCFVSPADLGESKYATETEKMVSERGLRVARELPRDSVLCVCIGSSIGKTGMTHHQRSCTNQQINAIVVSGSSNPHFIYYLLTFWSEHWRSHATFGPVPILNKGAFERVQVPFTSDRQEQDRIADVLSAVEEKVEHHMRHRDSFAALFRTLLHQLMTAQIRLCDVDLSALDESAVEPAGER